MLVRMTMTRAAEVSQHAYSSPNEYVSLAMFCDKGASGVKMIAAL